MVSTLIPASYSTGKDLCTSAWHLNPASYTVLCSQGWRVSVPLGWLVLGTQPGIQILLAWTSL